jgi:hypothetical protein
MSTLLPGLVLGFPPIRGGARRKGVHPMPFKKEWRHPRASPQRCRPSDRDFSRPPKKPRPRRSIALHQARRPPARATTILQAPPPSHRDLSNETDGNKEGQPGTRNGRAADTREGTASSANGGYRPDAATRADQALLARPSPWAREAPVAALQ